MSNNNRRSSRLASKRRIDYSEEQPNVHVNSLNPLNINLNKETVQIEEDAQDQTFESNRVNDNKIQNNEGSIETINLACTTSQYASSNSKLEGENIPGKFRRRTKVNRTKFEQAYKTLSELKSAIASTKSTIYSFETCLKGKNGDNASIDDNSSNSIMSINETSVIDVDNNNDSVMEYEDDNSHNVENSMDTTQKEDSRHLELTVNDQENELRQQDLIEIDFQGPLEAQNPLAVQENNSKSKQPPRFTLKLSNDLKKAFQPDLHISTSLEDTEVIVYDPTDSDFDNDDSIITVVEHKQNVMTTRKMSLNKKITDEDLLLSESQNKSFINSSFVQDGNDLSSTKQITKERDTLTSQIVCIDDEDEELKNQSSKKQDTIAGNHRQQEEQEEQDNTLIVNIGSNFTSRDESRVQEDQSITKDESEVRKNNKDINDSTFNEVSVIGTTSQSTDSSIIPRKNSGTSNKLKVQKNNSVAKKKGQNVTTVAKRVSIEASNAHKIQKGLIGSTSNSNASIDFESVKDKNSQRSDLTSAEKPISEKPIKNNLDDDVLSFGKSMLNKKNPPQKSIVRESPKNAETDKALESTTELTSIPNSSINEVVPAKRPIPDNSETSGDILGPLLEMLDGNRKKLIKSDNRETEINETSSMQEQSATDTPNLTNSPSDFREETMKIPYSSMSAEEHRKFLQIESMVHHNPELVSKEQYNFYHDMLKRVVNERKNFEQWQFERSKLFLGHLNQLIESKVMSHLKYGRHSNINDYPEVKLTIGLVPASLEEPELKFIQKLGTIGNCFEFSIPPITNPIPIPLKKELWIDDIPSTDTISEDSATKNYWKKTRTPVVSQDPLIHTLISSHKVDIVISSGSLVALTGLAESTDVELEIPIKIVEITKENSTSKIIYIDKPFVKNQMTPREINQIYYNTAFESMALEMNTCVNEMDNTKVENKSVGLQYSNNLEYSLWNIGDINILIRCRSNGYLRELDQKTRIVGIKTKLDYQLDYNYESITNIEQSRWWIYSIIRDKADLMLGRINVPTNTLCVIEKVSTEQILPDEARMKLLRKRLHYVFKDLQNSLSQGSYILRHEKGEPYAAVYKNEAIETAGNYSLQNPVKIDRETIPFVPLVWKGTQAQITGTFPIRAEPIRTGPARKKFCYDFARSGKCTRKKCPFLHVPKEQKIKSKKRKKQPENNNGGYDDLQYIADHVVEKAYDFDNTEESNGSSAPDFTTLLNNFKK